MGDSIVRERAAYRSQEEYLQANIKQSQKRIKDLNKENRHLSKSIASLKTEKQNLNRLMTPWPSKTTMNQSNRD